MFYEINLWQLKNRFISNFRVIKILKRFLYVIIKRVTKLRNIAFQVTKIKIKVHRIVRGQRVRDLKRLKDNKINKLNKEIEILQFNRKKRQITECKMKYTISTNLKNLKSRVNS